jgi:hypothetical protein
MIWHWFSPGQAGCDNYSIVALTGQHLQLTPLNYLEFSAPIRRGHYRVNRLRRERGVEKFSNRPHMIGNTDSDGGSPLNPETGQHRLAVLAEIGHSQGQSRATTRRVGFDRDQCECIR